MNLEDYNLKVVTRTDKMCALSPINVCVINGIDYTCNPGETEDEKIYIPMENLISGCAMSIKQREKTYIINIRKVFWKWYIEIWEAPYREKADYSLMEIHNFMLKNRVKDSFPMLK